MRVLQNGLSDEHVLAELTVLLENPVIQRSKAHAILWREHLKLADRMVVDAHNARAIELSRRGKP